MRKTSRKTIATLFSIYFNIVLCTILTLIVAVQTGEAQTQTPELLKAAILPIKSSNDPATSRHVTGYLETCLRERTVFQFAPGEKVDQVLAAGNYDMSKIYGLSTDEYKAIAEALGVDYVLHGIVAVRKSLKFTGWRKDVDVYIKLYDGKTGKTIDNWRSITDFSFTDSDTELDAEKMGETVADSICSKISQSSF